MPFPYKHILIIGATSGIGLALAERMLTNGCRIIAVGRRQEKLDELQSKHGKDRVSTFAFDITDLDKIAEFASKVTKQHPDVDCLLLNSGIQRSIDFSNPSSIDLNTFQTEITTNYTSYIYLLKYLLPPLQSLAASGTPTAIILVTSGLALVPMIRCGNYCASKAALHHLVMTTREQLRQQGVKVVEILPPAVQTELHDERHQPDIKDGRQIGMPLQEFVSETWDGLQAGHDAIAVGMSKQAWDGFETKRIEIFKESSKQMEKEMRKHDQPKEKNESLAAKFGQDFKNMEGKLT